MKFYKNIFKRGKSIFLLSTLSLFSFFGFLIVQENVNKSNVKTNTFNSELEDIDNYEKVMYEDTTQEAVVHSVEATEESIEIRYTYNIIPGGEYKSLHLEVFPMHANVPGMPDFIVSNYNLPPGEDVLLIIDETFSPEVNIVSGGNYYVGIWAIKTDDSIFDLYMNSNLWTPTISSSVSINKLEYDYETDSIIVDYTYIPQDPVFQEYARFDVYNNDLGRLEGRYKYLPSGENQIFIINEETLGVPISSNTNYTIDLWTIYSSENNNKHTSKTIYTERTTTTPTPSSTNGISWWIWVLISLGTISAIIFGLYILKKFTNIFDKKEHKSKNKKIKEVDVQKNEFESDFLDLDGGL